MPDQKKKRRTIQRVLKWVLTLVALGVVALVVWIELVPMIMPSAVTAYQSYTAETGDISTTKSFSATLSVKKSETFSTEEESMVRALYVQSGDEVQKGDSLVLLSTGDLFTASFDGVVNEIRVKEGDWIWPNFQVVQVCDLQHLEVSMNVDEYDVEKLSVGQSCTVSVISLGVDFDTIIAHINRVSQSQGTVAFYSVTCDLTVPENVLPGMQATVTLPSDALQGVTTLDMAALAFDEDKNPYVLSLQSDGTYKKVAVETGLSDGMKVQILSGINAGDVVYAVSGTENVKANNTLEDIYKAIMGEKVVVNDRSTQGGPGGGGMPSGEMPSGEMPSGAMPSGAPTGDGQTDGATASGSQTGAVATDANAGQTTDSSGSTELATQTVAPGATVAPDGTGSAGTDGTASATVTDATGGGPQGSGNGKPPESGAAAGADISAIATPVTTQEGGTADAN